MKSIELLRIGVAALFLSLGQVVVAQVQGGEFGTASDFARWSWSSGVQSNGCNLSPISATQIASRRIWITNPHGGVQGSLADITARRGECLELRQRFFVPTGHKLQFSFGTYIAASPIGQLPAQALAEARLVDPVSRAETLLVRRENAVLCSFSGVGCNYISEIEASLDSFWGREVEIVFVVRDTSIYPLSFALNPALTYVDSVRTVPLAVSTSALPVSGSWFNPDRSGTGFNFSRTSDGKRIATWFTYRQDGAPVWYLSDAAHVSGGVWQSNIHKVTRNVYTGAIGMTPVGWLRLSLFTPSTGMMEWSLMGRSGSGRLVHLAGGGEYTGQWYNPETSGNGFNLDHFFQGGEKAAVTLFYYRGEEPVWALGVANGPPTNSKIFELTGYTSQGLCPGCEGHISMHPFLVGTITLSLNFGYGTGHAAVTDVFGGHFVAGEPWRPVAFYQLTYP